MKFMLAGKDGSGDATVPEPSGAAVVEKVNLKATFRMQGFAHAESYNDKLVQDNTVYCIDRIVQDATPVKELPQKGSKCSANESDDASLNTQEEAWDEYSSPLASASAPQPDKRTGSA